MSKSKTVEINSCCSDVKVVAPDVDGDGLPDYDIDNGNGGNGGEENCTCDFLVVSTFNVPLFMASPLST